MATKLFLRDTKDNGIGVFRDLSTTAGPGVALLGEISTVSGATEIQWKSNGEAEVLEWITGRSPAGGWTLSGTVSFSAWCRESNMNANCGVRARLFKRTAAGTETEIGGGPFNDGVEFSTGSTEMTWSGTPTSTAFAENDRLIVRLYITNIGTMGNGFLCQLDFGAPDTQQGDSFIQITPTVVFKSDADLDVPVTGVSVTGSVGTVAAFPVVDVTVPVSGLEATLAVERNTTPYSSTVGENLRVVSPSLAPAIAATFQGDGSVITQVVWEMRRVSSPVGQVMTAAIYSIGADGAPESLLGTSDSVDAMTPPTGFGAHAPITFNFPSNQRVVTSSDAEYAAVLICNFTEGGQDQILFASPNPGPGRSYTSNTSFSTWTLQDEIYRGTVSGVGAVTVQIDTPAGDATATPDGLVATGQVGTITVLGDATVAITGQQASGQLGTVALDITTIATVIGAQAAGQVGTVLVLSDVIATVSGEAATASVGDVAVDTVEPNVTVPVTGTQAATQLGTAIVSIDVDVPVTGASATGQTGTLTTTSSTDAVVSGLAASGQVGAVVLTASADVPVTGNEATGQVGSVSVQLGGDATATITGTSASGAVGSVAILASADVALTGTTTTGQTGTVTVLPETFTIAVGAQATGQTGTVAVLTSAVVSVVGVEATGQVGSVSVVTTGSVVVTVSGIEARGDVGTVLAGLIVADETADPSDGVSVKRSADRTKARFVSTVVVIAPVLKGLAVSALAPRAVAKMDLLGSPGPRAVVSARAKAAVETRRAQLPQLRAQLQPQLQRMCTSVRDVDLEDLHDLMEVL